MINALEKPTYGNIYQKAKSLKLLNLIELGRSIGYVIQEAGLFPHYTVFENITTVMSLHKIDKKLIVEKVESWMKSLGLDFDNQKHIP